MTEDPRLGALLEVMLSLARQDFAVSAPVGSSGDAIDAIAVGLNMLIEELRGEVASRRELQRANEELEQAQVRLVHAGKLAAIGQLAAGVAHEINNPVQSIQGCLAIVQRAHALTLAALSEGDLASARARLAVGEAAVADAHEAIERVGGVTASLRTFARADDEGTGPVAFDDLVRVAARLVSVSTPAAALVELSLAHVLVEGNRGKLGQVVTNLLLNALQALPDGGGAGHAVRVSVDAIDGYGRLRVDDSGPGVPAGDRARIFLPFFTTKPAELGTGLGLSLAADLVRSHGGTLGVSDSPLGGARFEVLIPLSVSKPPEPRAVEVPAPRSSRPRVLVVDDEELLLRVYAALLGEAFDVVTARSGAEALALMRAERFDHVVCDLEMAGMDGVALFEAVLGFAPELAKKFIFATGGAVTARGRAFLDAGRAPVLQKPFKVATLLDVLQG